MAEHLRNRKVQPVPGRDRDLPPTQETQLLVALAAAQPPAADEIDSEIESICSYIDHRYDCSDFRAITLLRILYEYAERLPETSLQRTEECLAGFKYWMDEPGHDSMCYWSENHQILFAACEYLAGQRMPDRVFSNDGRTGAEHAASARERILTWCDLRWRYGYTEWYSTVYYTEDIAPLANLIDFAEDKEIVAAATVALDLLLLDLASQSFSGSIIASSGRLYENQKKSPWTTSILPALREMEQDADARARKGQWDLAGLPTSMVANFILRSNYEVPEVLRQIARDQGAAEIRSSQGLELNELRRIGLLGQSDRQIMMQWGMEAFTNPQTLSNTMAAFERMDMFRQEPFRALSFLRLTLLRFPGAYRLLSSVLRPQSNGVAIQRGNAYTYRTRDYKLSTAQAYHPGEYGDQQHVWSAGLAPKAAVFTTHPATLPGGTQPFGNSPGYWVGSGYLPHSVQHRNVNLTLYRLPRRSGPMAAPVVPFTHAWLEEDAFDEIVEIERGIIGRSGSGYLALLCAEPWEYRVEPGPEAITPADTGPSPAAAVAASATGQGGRNEIIQEGLCTGWVCEVSGETDRESFVAFVDRVKSAELVFEKDARKVGTTLRYANGRRSYDLVFGRGFYVDNEPQLLDYQRMESPYCDTRRDPAVMTIGFGNHRLDLRREGWQRDHTV